MSRAPDDVRKQQAQPGQEGQREQEGPQEPREPPPPPSPEAVDVALVVAAFGDVAPEFAADARARGEVQVIGYSTVLVVAIVLSLLFPKIARRLVVSLDAEVARIALLLFGLGLLILGVLGVARIIEGITLLTSPTLGAAKFLLYP